MPNIVSQFVTVLWFVGILGVHIIVPSPHNWRSQLPELLLLVMLFGAIYLITLLAFDGPRYSLASVLLLIGLWLLGRAMVRR